MRKSAVKVELRDPELLELISEEEEAWLNSLPPEELIQHGGKYIATRRKQIIASSESLEGLYQQLDAKGIRHARIRYVEDPRSVAIYGSRDSDKRPDVLCSRGGSLSTWSGGLLRLLPRHL